MRRVLFATNGMTLVEVMVALVILGVGLLGVAAGMDFAGRSAGRARRMEEMVAQVRATVDSLQGRACAMGVARGTAPEDQSWSVIPGPLSTRTVKDSAGPGVSLTAVVLCP